MRLIRAFVVGTLLVGCAIVAWPRSASSQVLDQLRHDIRDGTGDSAGSAPPAPSSDDHSKDSFGNSWNGGNSTGPADDGGELTAAAVEGIGFVIAAPYLMPNRMLGDDYDPPSYFLRYPYWHAEPGSMFNVAPYGARLRTWQTEWAFEYADNLDDLTRYGGHFRLSTISRFDFETNWNMLEDNGSRGRDHVSLGDFDVLFRFAQSETWQFRSGLGANWFDDHQGAVAGFNFRYGADWYPCRPWHLAALIDAGELGKAGLIHLRTTAGVTYARWELFTGLDYRKIGSVHFGGPLAGVQFRF